MPGYVSVLSLMLTRACAGQSGRCEDDDARQHPADARQRRAARSDQRKRGEPQ